MRRLRIGTRRSDLARWQANHVVAGIGGLAGAPSVEVLYIKTEGDRITDVPLYTIPGKSFFTKEIEQALLDEQVDVAVHSLKDVATELPRGLVIGAVMEREDPRDVLLSHGGIPLEDLAPGARIGTSSLRRKALLRRWRPDLDLVDLRGNVPTRIRKLSEGRFDAIVLAAAGVKRLGFESRITAYLPLERVLPAVAQGAVALQVREDDEYVLSWVRQLDDADTRQATAAERALLGRLEGGCQVPVGALATVSNGVLTLQAVVASLDGTRSVEGTREGPSDQAEQIGGSLAEELLGRGAGVILDEIRATTGEV
ncbi:MAG: hydroxymethylbilane synthase, partial [Gemmatimonadetes bacterium]|nr:hydroxymethylbilane synthase [Gemmatimonadota bacterium]